MSEPFDPYRKWLGIPPKDQPPNHYRLLAVELFEDDPDIISNAADRLMAHVRTFQSGPHSPESQKLLNELAAARHCLLDLTKKAQYDRQLRDRLLGTQGAAPPSPPGPALTRAPQSAAPAPIPAAVPIPAPVLAPQAYPYPVQPPAPIAAPQPAAPYVPAITTKSLVRRKSAWQMPAAVVVVAAALLVSTYYLLQFAKQGPVARLDAPRTNAADPRPPLETKDAEPPRAATAKERVKQRLDRGSKPSDAISSGRQTSPNDLGAQADRNARSNLTEVAEPIRPSPGKPAAPATADKPGSAPRSDHRTLGALLDGPEIKPPVPDPKDLAKAERQARELFGDALAGAKQLEQKQALAFRLIDKASENQTDPAAHFVLLRMARDAGAEGGSAKTVAMAVDEMAKWYRVDPRELKLDALAKAGKAGATPQLKQELASAALALIDECVSADEYDQAAKSAGLALSAGRALKDPRLMKEIADKKREADRIAKAHAAAREDFDRLKADENDPAANLAAGKFYCLAKQQWDKGLPHFARGSDPSLKALAERDLAKPGSADDQKALADDWRALGETEKGPGQAAILNRAAFWYRRALPFLAGLEKETVEKRLGELDADGPANGPETKYLADIPEANVSAYGNGFGKGRDNNGNELKVDGKVSPKGLFLPPPSRGAASVAYLVNKKALLFTADVGLNAPYNSIASPMIFELWGDGGLLWRSKPVQNSQDADHCEAPIGKIQILELRVLCPGSNSGAKAVWVEPRLTLK